MATKSIKQIYRCFLSEDDFPLRLIFETRYFAQKYKDVFYQSVDPQYFYIQKDPFGSYDGYCLIFLHFERGDDII